MTVLMRVYALRAPPATAMVTAATTRAWATVTELVAAAPLPAAAHCMGLKGPATTLQPWSSHG